MITQTLVKELFDYKDGELYWKVSPHGKIKVNTITGTYHPNGYKLTKINGKIYRNHRIIFLMFNGYLPKCIDHIDGNKLNNKIENLREANFSENGLNSKKPKNNTSGTKNITYNKVTNRWRVRIIVNGSMKTIGSYKDIELAELVAFEARNKFHKEFARHQ